MDAEYPQFLFVEHRGQVFPGVRLPTDYMTLVPSFYERGGRTRIEDYTKNLDNSLEDIYGKPGIRLQWDCERGLVNISIGISGGLDLNCNSLSFQEHNLGSETSLAVGSIAINYVYELSKSRSKE